MELPPTDVQESWFVSVPTVFHYELKSYKKEKKKLAKLNIPDFYVSLKCNLFTLICVCVHACASGGDEGNCGSWFSASTRNTDCFMILHVILGQGPILVYIFLKLEKSQWP